MEKRSLGGLGVSALGIGCMPMAGIGAAMYGAANEDEAIATIHEAIDLGVTFFDTAEVYGPFRNEDLLGRAIRDRRDGLQIATKYGFRIVDGQIQGTDGSPERARAACEASLGRLGIEAIDLFYLHRIDPDVPIEESVGAMARLVEEGKVRHIGLSEAGAETLRRAAAVHPIAALQSEYSLWERTVETEILPTARELGIGFVPYSPLGRGFLTGAVGAGAELPEGDYRRNDPRYGEGNAQANARIVEAIRDVAGRHGASAAQVALAWLMAQGNDVVPIPGTKRRATMRDSVGAADVRLSPEDLADLDRAAPVGGTAGERYQPQQMRMVRL